MALGFVRSLESEPETKGWLFEREAAAVRLVCAGPVPARELLRAQQLAWGEDQDSVEILASSNLPANKTHHRQPTDFNEQRANSHADNQHRDSDDGTRAERASRLNRRTLWLTVRFRAKELIPFSEPVVQPSTLIRFSPRPMNRPNPFLALRCQRLGPIESGHRDVGSEAWAARLLNRSSHVGASVGKANALKRLAARLAVNSLPPDVAAGCSSGKALSSRREQVREHRNGLKTVIATF